MVLLGDNSEFVAEVVVHLPADAGSDFTVVEPDENLSVERMQPGKHRLVVSREPDPGTIERDRLFGPSEHSRKEPPTGLADSRSELGGHVLEGVAEPSDVVYGVFRDRQDRSVRGGDSGDRTNLAVPSGSGPEV
jgi:hypothetical protein